MASVSAARRLVNDDLLNPTREPWVEKALATAVVARSAEAIALLRIMLWLMNVPLM